MIGTINIALSGLAAATKQVTASASNIANIQTVGSVENGQQAPYAPLTVKQTSDGETGGVRAQITPSNRPFTPAFSPDSPFANSEGIIGVPNINIAEQAVNLIVAETSYKANLEIIETASELSDELLNIFDEDA